MEQKAIALFVMCFLGLCYAVMTREWRALYVALPGMLVSAIAYVFVFLGGV